MRWLVVPSITVLSATAASAHPDHLGSPAADVVHYVTDPFHLATLALGVAVLGSLASLWRVRQRRAALPRRRR